MILALIDRVYSATWCAKPHRPAREDRVVDPVTISAESTIGRQRQNNHSGWYGAVEPHTAKDGAKLLQSAGKSSPWCEMEESGMIGTTDPVISSFFV